MVYSIYHVIPSKKQEALPDSMDSDLSSDHYLNDTSLHPRFLLIKKRLRPFFFIILSSF